MAQPLILTLKMDERSQERFDRMRELHFPPERNYLNATSPSSTSYRARRKRKSPPNFAKYAASKTP